MPRFAANLTMLFNEVPFLDRFAAAAAAGFRGVEYLFPYDFPASEIAQRLADHGLSQVLFNLPPGDWAAGDRGMAAIPGREREFADSVERALEYATKLNCSQIHAMAGLVPTPMAEQARATYIENLRYACARLAPYGITLLIEPINNRDIPGFFLNRTDVARGIIDAVGAPNLGLQLDLYHCQIMEGDLAHHLRDLADITRHIQIAGVPERHEPTLGEINYPYLFQLIDALGYHGWIGCEYRPAGETTAGLGWLATA